ncbi:SIMPL domain-containing protein [Candidatus Nomurabacteria bacterium]|nr:SIMPL domain-containing protein [Candidatus Nomurabacteria bacterium]
MKNYSAPQFLMTAGGVFLSILTILAIVGIIMALLSTRSYQERNKTINVQGTGEVFVQPDIAEFSFTVLEESDTVDAAQTAVSESIKKISDGLAQLGIEGKDIQTQSYSSNPRYEWKNTDCTEFGGCNSERVLKGYELQQSVNVIVRDLDTTGDVLSLLGESNVDNLYGPNLRVEDTDEARIAAREEAIEKAKDEAKQLAKSLGVNLGKMIDFYEDQGGYYPEPMYAKTMATGVAMDMAYEESAAPSIQTGENRVSSTVHLTFKIK